MVAARTPLLMNSLRARHGSDEPPVAPPPYVDRILRGESRSNFL
jgi:hypothetical protein